MTELVDIASIFSVAAHEAVGQRRKYSNEPYWKHPAAVANLIQDAGYSDEVIAAALLHDVLEDTKVSAETIAWAFGQDVADLVLEVTDVSRLADGNRAARKAIDRDHLAKASAAGQTIKVADLIDNTSTIVAHDPDFARIYMAEKRALLEVLTRADAGLLARAWEIVNAYERATETV